ncbi:protein of unknown function [Ralstonia solanacearum CFBP2957]|nr:protein of unknown function [Ralstonia solanacearum CFBP2957]
MDCLSTAGNIAGQRPDSDFLLNLLHRVDRQRLAELATSNPNPAQAAPVPASPPVAPQADTTEAGGTTIQEMVPRFPWGNACWNATKNCAVRRIRCASTPCRSAPRMRGLPRMA